MIGIREDIEAAISTLSEDSGGTGADSPPTDSPPPTETAPAEAPVEAASETPTPETPETKAAAAARARDDKGRFAGKAGGQQASAPQAPATEGKPQGSSPPPPGAGVTAPTPGAPAAPELKPPQSWKPAAREHWAALPADVRAEVVRRDREVQQALQEAAPAKREAEAFRQVIAPFEAGIRAEGGEPLEAVRSLFQTAHALRGPQRAQVLARLMAQFDVSEESLVAALQGQPAQQPAAPGGYRDPRVDQLFSRLEQAQAQRQHATQSKANQDVEGFAEKHEFFHDVRDSMAEVMAMAVQRGDKTMTLERAYSVACRMSDEVAGILEQRKAAKSANASNASTQKAKAAASSIKGQPAGATGAPQPNSLRADIEAAMGSLTGR